MAPQLDAPNHQHLFNMRLDLEVDGPDNTVVEVDAVGMPIGPDNPYGNAIVARKTPIGNERDSRRMCDPLTARTWKIINPGVLNRQGEPVAYKLVPFVGPTLLAAPDSDLARRAEFARTPPRDQATAADQRPDRTDDRTAPGVVIDDLRHAGLASVGLSPPRFLQRRTAAPDVQVY